MKASAFWTLTANPFSRIGGWKAFFIGFAVLLVTIGIGYWGGLAPAGLLYIMTIDNLSISTLLICHFSVLLMLFATMYITALISTRRVRFQDALGITVLAQVPVLLLNALTLLMKPTINQLLSTMRNGGFEATTRMQPLGNNLYMVLMSILLMVTLVWYIILLYNGFKTLTDLKGAKSVVLFAILIVLCDILSSVLISFLTNGGVNRLFFINT